MLGSVAVGISVVWRDSRELGGEMPTGETEPRSAMARRKTRRKAEAMNAETRAAGELKKVGQKRCPRPLLGSSANTLLCAGEGMAPGLEKSKDKRQEYKGKQECPPHHFVVCGFSLVDGAGDPVPGREKLAVFSSQTDGVRWGLAVCGGRRGFVMR